MDGWMDGWFQLLSLRRLSLLATMLARSSSRWFPRGSIDRMQRSIDRRWALPSRCPSFFWLVPLLAWFANSPTIHRRRRGRLCNFKLQETKDRKCARAGLSWSILEFEWMLKLIGRERIRGYGRELRYVRTRVDYCTCTVRTVRYRRKTFKWHSLPNLQMNTVL